MSATSEVKEEAEALYMQGFELAGKFKAGMDLAAFRDIYNGWYTKAVRVVRTIAPERLKEFQSYYEIDPKRKFSGFGHYSIQDYLKAVAPSHSVGFDPKQYTHTIFSNQLSILRSLIPLLSSRIADISSELFFDLVDEELRTAHELMSTSVRAAGALAGVVLEKHLHKLLLSRGIDFTKRNPTIADLNDLLKKNDVYDTPAWRKVAYLGDIRNICSHEKGAEPIESRIRW